MPRAKTRTPVRDAFGVFSDANQREAAALALFQAPGAAQSAEERRAVWSGRVQTLTALDRVITASTTGYNALGRKPEVRQAPSVENRPPKGPSSKTAEATQRKAFASRAAYGLARGLIGDLCHLAWSLNTKWNYSGSTTVQTTLDSLPGVGANSDVSAKRYADNVSEPVLIDQIETVMNHLADILESTVYVYQAPELQAEAGGQEARDKPTEYFPAHSVVLLRQPTLVPKGQADDSVDMEVLGWLNIGGSPYAVLTEHAVHDFLASGEARAAIISPELDTLIGEAHAAIRADFDTVLATPGKSMGIS